MYQRAIENQGPSIAERAAERARYYVDRAIDDARTLAEWRREFGTRPGRYDNQYGRQLANKAEDFADEANHRYRRMRRHVLRHPVPALAIVACTIGTFLLLSRAFRRRSDED